MEMDKLSVQNLTVGYPGYTAASNISFTLKKGDFLAVIGPNGGGKTTIMKTLAGILSPVSGTLLYSGKPLSELSRRQIAYIPQMKDISLHFPATVEELIETGRTGTWPFWLSPKMKKSILSVMEKTGIEKLAGRSLSELSGGELQRVYLSRAFYRNPEILLLDEPVTGLDVRAGKDLFSILETFQSSGKTIIIMVTHDIQTAYSHANRVLLVNGKQIECNTPSAALTAHCLQETFGHEGHRHGLFQIPGANHDL